MNIVVLSGGGGKLVYELPESVVSSLSQVSPATREEFIGEIESAFADVHERYRA